MLAAESVTCVFWLGGFAGMASDFKHGSFHEAGAGSALKGSVVTGVFEL
jgi:hypothetical protein